MPTIAHDRLRAFVHAVCVAGGSEALEAQLVAEHLVEANLTGHDSHGVGMLPSYVNNLHAGRLLPNRHAEVVVDFGAVLVVEGHRGYGQVIAREAMELGMERARAQGAAVVALRNSHHVGRIGHWGEQCARGGFASMHYVNVADHLPLVATYGGSDARLGTNPFCAALPGDGGPAFLLDMATSKIAFGKARVAFNRGEPVPEGTLLDGEGRPTRDPGVMFQEPRRGALVPVGEHKGAGLAVLCELLGGALTGSATIQPGTPKRGGIVNGMLTVIIDPGALGDAQRVRDEVAATTAWVKASPPAPGFDEVLVAGEPEVRRRAQRAAQGVAIDGRTYAELIAAAASLGLDEARARAMCEGE